MDPIEFDYDFHKHYELIVNKKAYTTKGLCGLLNLGNKCYLNSILQCLSNTLSLTDYILSSKYKQDFDNTHHKNEHYFLHSYVTLINHIWDENQLIKPKSLIENLGKFHKKYFSMQQQDSHECLLYILDLLHTSLSYEITININGNIQNKSDQLMKQSLDVWKSFYEKQYSFIIQTFYGNSLNYIECNNCNLTDTVFEPYNNLTLPITGTSLQSCLDNYFSTVQTIQTWKCTKCNHLGCNTSNNLWTIPNYLIINLKRFDTKTHNCTKNSSLITYPITNLNLTKYISTDKHDSNNYIYDLYAINYHTGDINNGHYWSSCKNLDGNWYNYNDGNISKFNNNNTSTLSSQLITKDAYILFYSRKFIKKPLQI